MVLGLCVLVAMASQSAFADPKAWRTQGWAKTDFSKTSIPFSEIFSGGVAKDGIPAIDKPKFVDMSKVKDIGADEPVISLTIGGERRAYPLRIMIWHEIVNDVVGDVPVAVTYCPLCNAAIVFDRRLGGQAGGRVLDFGTTGKLRNSDLVMYDRQSESWWQQFSGEALVGELMGQSLKFMPARLESFSRFKAGGDKGAVLVPNNPKYRPYGKNPYAGYDRAKAPFLYDGELPKGIHAMARIIVIRSDGKPRAVTLELLRKMGKLSLGDIVVSWESGQNSALDNAQIMQGRDVGNVVVQRGSADIPYDVTFAFVFHAFHPDEAIRQH